MNNEMFLHFFQTIIESLDVGVHAIDSNGKTVIYNKKMRDIEGMAIEDVLDKNILDVFTFYQGENSTLLKVLATGNPIFNRKQTYFNNKGIEINTLNHTIPITGGDSAIGAVELVKDVTKYEKMAREQNQGTANREIDIELLFNHEVFSRNVMETAIWTAHSHPFVFITGEPGSGKELLAEFILLESGKLDRDLLRQKCDSYPEEYLDQILFGTKNTEGLIDQVESKSLLLEEVQELSIPLQRKLLEKLERQKDEKTGSDPVMPCMITTMSKDPFDAIAEERLLKDLYYYLGKSVIRIPPLRERRRGILKVVSYFIQKYNHLFHMKVQGISEETSEAFLSYNWPGNMKEAERVIESAMLVMENEDLIEYQHLPVYFRHKHPPENDFILHKDRKLIPLEDYLQETEKYYIQKALQYHHYNITQTARALKMSRQNLQYRIRKYNLKG